jgi:hypothetical protein
VLINFTLFQSAPDTNQNLSDIGQPVSDAVVLRLTRLPTTTTDRRCSHAHESKRTFDRSRAVAACRARGQLHRLAAIATLAVTSALATAAS